MRAVLLLLVFAVASGASAQTPDPDLEGVVDPHVRVEYAKMKAGRVDVERLGKALDSVRADYEAAPEPAAFEERRRAARAEFSDAVDHLADTRSRYMAMAQTLIGTRALEVVARRGSGPPPTAADIGGFDRTMECCDKVKWSVVSWRFQLETEAQAYAAARRRVLENRRRRLWGAAGAAVALVGLGLTVWTRRFLHRKRLEAAGTTLLR